MVPVLLLVSFLSFGAVSSFAKDKSKGKTVLFEDGWQALKPVDGENQTGNFTCISLEGEAVQSANKKWTSSWGNWTVNGTDGESKRGVVMVPNKEINDDWLISEEIDLNDCKKPVLNIEAYSKYGTAAGNDLKVLISTNYNGDIESANWDELYLESIHKQNQAVGRRILLKKYLGEKVVVAFRSIHKGKSLKNLTRTTFISKVTVSAMKK
ncbi:choice-of-anchor J domain-containing protein [Ancylomarina sp. YFZ004]